MKIVACKLDDFQYSCLFPAYNVGFVTRQFVNVKIGTKLVVEFVVEDVISSVGLRIPSMSSGFWRVKAVSF